MALMKLLILNYNYKVINSYLYVLHNQDYISTNLHLLLQNRVTDFYLLNLIPFEVLVPANLDST